MLYVTCSVFKAEGEQQIEAFLKQHRDAQLLPSFGHCLPLMPEPSTHGPQNLAQSRSGSDFATDFSTDFATFPNAEHDGFFYALLRKAA
jgi:16S rRNA (cytosine967-C5)-methyltransferase